MKTRMNEHARIQARSRITSKGQTTVPKEVRDALSLGEGTQIEWIVERDRATALVKPRTVRAIELAGFLGKPPNGRHLTIEEMNDEVGKAVGERFRRKTAR